MAEAADRTAKRGMIVLARHGEPALSRRIRLNAEGYRRWWAAYEEGGILPGQTPPPGLIDLARDADVVFASTRRRAIETADAVVRGRPFTRDAMFVEAPLPPPHLPSFITLKPSTWGFWARFVWWWFNHSEGQETRDQALKRARDVADRLIATAEGGATVLVLAHGFFNFMVARELKRRGWRQSEGRGYKSLSAKYWATKRFTPA